MHDYWQDQGNRWSLDLKLSNWLEQCAKHRVISLDGQALAFNGATIYGWNNWYGTPRHLRGTNDEYHLSIEDEKVLYDEDIRGFEGVPLGVDVLITHMPIIPNPGYDQWNGSIWQWSWLADKGLLPKVYMHGHTHQERDEVIDGVRVVMCGSDYDRLKYKIIEV